MRPPFQIGSLDFRARQQFLAGAGDRDLAVDHDIAAVGKLQRVECILLDEEHCDSLGAVEFTDGGENLLHDQRREAEGLVGFMLGDLKDKLEPIGRLDALDAVGSRALDYYQRQDRGALSDEALAQRARALTLIGEQTPSYVVVPPLKVERSNLAESYKTIYRIDLPADMQEALTQ